MPSISVALSYPLFFSPYTRKSEKHQVNYGLIDIVHVTREWQWIWMGRSSPCTRHALVVGAGDSGANLTGHRWGSAHRSSPRLTLRCTSTQVHVPRYTEWLRHRSSSLA